MATSNDPILLSLEAGADLSAAQWLLVKVGTTQNQVVLATAGSDAIGVLYEPNSAAGRAVAVAVGGIVRAYAGGTVAIGAKVAADSAGKIITAVTGGTVSVLGTATTAGAVGAMIEFIWQKQGILA